MSSKRGKTAKASERQEKRQSHAKWLTRAKKSSKQKKNSTPTEINSPLTLSM
jgi:hypothetical protein